MLHYWNLFENTEYYLAEMIWETEMVFCIHATAADTGHDMSILDTGHQHSTDNGFGKYCIYCIDFSV